jgi:hypothetical protein
LEFSGREKCSERHRRRSASTTLKDRRDRRRI